MPRKPKHACLICDDPPSLEYCLTQATSEEIGMVLKMKLCAIHEEQVRKAETKHESERTVA